MITTKQKKLIVKRFKPPESYFIVDVETSGLNLILDEIVEIAIVFVTNNEIISSFESLVRPSSAILTNKEKIAKIYEITGISEIDLLSATSLQLVRKSFQQWIKGFSQITNSLTAYNIKFDKNFLQKDGWLDNFVGHWDFCVMIEAKKVLSTFNVLPFFSWCNDFKNPSLVESHRFLCNTKRIQSHRALDDVLMTLDVINQLS